jgi:hypothetical protein
MTSLHLARSDYVHDCAQAVETSVQFVAESEVFGTTTQSEQQ